jgi:hypothetical protein
MEPRNRCQGINSASLCSLAGRYDNPIPTRCLVPIEFLKIPALRGDNFRGIQTNRGSFGIFSMYRIQHCFNFRRSDFTVPEDAGIEPRTVATSALAVRRSNHSARSYPRLEQISSTTRLDLIHRLG